MNAPPTADYFDYPDADRISESARVSVSDLHGVLGVRARKALFRLGCETLADAANLTVADLLASKTCGWHTVKEIERTLERFGMSLRHPSSIRLTA